MTALFSSKFAPTGGFFLSHDGGDAIWLSNYKRPWKLRRASDGHVIDFKADCEVPREFRLSCRDFDLIEPITGSRLQLELEDRRDGHKTMHAAWKIQKARADSYTLELCS